MPSILLHSSEVFSVLVLGSMINLKKNLGLWVFFFKSQLLNAGQAQVMQK